ncbi:MAG: Clp protease N-terminal domain-containing protein, partial [Anaerolineales bacterium]
MNLEKFTQKSQEAIFSAQQIAQDYHHSAIEPIHLELALLRQEDGVVPAIVTRVAGSTLALREELERELAKRPQMHGVTMEVGLSQAAVDVLNAAERYAKGMSDDYVSTEHILLALLQQEDGLVPKILEKMGVDPEAVERLVEQELEYLPRSFRNYSMQLHIYLTSRAKAVLDAAGQEAAKMQDEFIGTEHIFLAIAGEREGPSVRILRSFGIDQERIHRALAEIRGAHRLTDPHADSRYQALEKYGHDLTRAAREGKLDPVIGREDEILRVMQILS